MRLAVATLLALLLLATPAWASSVTIQSVDTAASAAAGARAVYRVAFTTSAGGAMAGGATVRVTLPAGTTTAGWQDGVLRDVTRAADVGSCGIPNAQLVSTCALSAAAVVNAGDQVLVTLRGLTNGAAGSKTLQVETTGDADPATSPPFQIVAGGSVSQPSVAVDDPSAATGARTRYVIAFTVSSTGGLSGEAGSAISVTVPAGTTAPGWAGGEVRDVTRNVDVGSCTNPGTSLVSTCSLFFSGVVNPGDEVRVTLRGLTNGSVGSKTAQVATTSDLPARTSGQFQVIGANALTGVGVTVGSTAPLERTPYAVRFTASATGGLSNEAGSQIRLVFPAGTNFGVFDGGRVHDVTRGVDVGSCGAPSGTTLLCGFLIGAFVNPGDAVRLSFDAITNPPTAGPYSLTVTTTSDTAPVDSGPYAEPDTVAPETGIDSGPGTGTPTFTFSSSEPGSRFECALDGGAYAACQSPHTLHGLDQGPHTFAVRAIDGAGNTDATPASRTFTLDTVAPVTTIDSGPGAGTPTFTFSSDDTGSRFECALDGGAFAACTSPHSLGPLAEGVYAWTVRAVDAAGNVGTPAVRTFIVSTRTATATPTPTPTGSSTATPVPPPQFNQSVVVKPVSGTVLVCPRGEPCRPLRAGERIPIGSTIDTKRGVVELASVAAAGAPPQTARFSEGIFRVSQRGAVTELTLTEPLAPCGNQARATAAKKPKKRRLWGNGKGKFRTRGYYSAATVRGTRWLVEDSCAGTLTRVTEGVVSVHDIVRGRTLTLRKGQSYLAKPRR